MMSESKYYVYAHLKKSNKEIFYVGKGFGNRSHSKYRRSKYWNRIVNKYGYIIVKFEENLTNEKSLEREKYWINIFKRKIHGGTLINMTNGGDGGDTISNHPRRKEIISKVSQSNKGINNANYGSKLVTKEFIEKQINSNSKKPIKVIDTITKNITFYKNSKECAYALNSKPSNVRMCKNKYKLKRRYIIVDK